MMRQLGASCATAPQLLLHGEGPACYPRPQGPEKAEVIG